MASVNPLQDDFDSQDDASPASSGMLATSSALDATLAPHSADDQQTSGEGSGDGGVNSNSGDGVTGSSAVIEVQLPLQHSVPQVDSGGTGGAGLNGSFVSCDDSGSRRVTPVSHQDRSGDGSTSAQNGVDDAAPGDSSVSAFDFSASPSADTSQVSSFSHHHQKANTAGAGDAHASIKAEIAAATKARRKRNTVVAMKDSETDTCSDLPCENELEALAKAHETVRRFSHLLQLFVEDNDFPFVQEFVGMVHSDDATAKALESTRLQEEEVITGLKAQIKRVLASADDEEVKVEKLKEIRQRQEVMFLSRAKKMKALSEAQADIRKAQFRDDNRSAIDSCVSSRDLFTSSDRILQSLQGMLGKLFLFVQFSIEHSRVPRPERILWAGEEDKKTILGLGNLPSQIEEDLFTEFRAELFAMDANENNIQEELLEKVRNANVERYKELFNLTSASELVGVGATPGHDHLVSVSSALESANSAPALRSGKSPKPKSLGSISGGGKKGHSSSSGGRSPVGATLHRATTSIINSSRQAAASSSCGGGGGGSATVSRTTSSTGVKSTTSGGQLKRAKSTVTAGDSATTKKTTTHKRHTHHSAAHASSSPAHHDNGSRRSSLASSAQATPRPDHDLPAVLSTDEAVSAASADFVAFEVDGGGGAKALTSIHLDGHDHHTTAQQLKSQEEAIASAMDDVTSITTDNEDDDDADGSRGDSPISDSSSKKNAVQKTHRQSAPNVKKKAGEPGRGESSPVPPSSVGGKSPSGTVATPTPGVASDVKTKSAAQSSSATKPTSSPAANDVDGTQVETSVSPRGISISTSSKTFQSQHSSGAAGGSSGSFAGNAAGGSGGAPVITSRRGSLTFSLQETPLPSPTPHNAATDSKDDTAAEPPGDHQEPAVAQRSSVLAPPPEPETTAAVDPATFHETPSLIVTSHLHTDDAEDHGAAEPEPLCVDSSVALVEGTTTPEEQVVVVSSTATSTGKLPTAVPSSSLLKKSDSDASLGSKTGSVVSGGRRSSGATSNQGRRWSSNSTVSSMGMGSAAGSVQQASLLGAGGGAYGSSSSLSSQHQQLQSLLAGAGGTSQDPHQQELLEAVLASTGSSQRRASNSLSIASRRGSNISLADGEPVSPQFFDFSQQQFGSPSNLSASNISSLAGGLSAAALANPHAVGGGVGPDGSRGRTESVTSTTSVFGADGRVGVLSGLAAAAAAAQDDEIPKSARRETQVFHKPASPDKKADSPLPTTESQEEHQEEVAAATPPVVDAAKGAGATTAEEIEFDVPLPAQMGASGADESPTVVPVITLPGYVVGARRQSYGSQETSGSQQHSPGAAAGSHAVFTRLPDSSHPSASDTNTENDHHRPFSDDTTAAADGVGANAELTSFTVTGVSPTSEAHHMMRRASAATAGPRSPNMLASDGGGGGGGGTNPDITLSLASSHASSVADSSDLGGLAETADDKQHNRDGGTATPSIGAAATSGHDEPVPRAPSAGAGTGASDALASGCASDQLIPLHVPSSEATNEELEHQQKLEKALQQTPEQISTSAAASPPATSISHTSAKLRARTERVARRTPGTTPLPSSLSPPPHTSVMPGVSVSDDGAPPPFSLPTNTTAVSSSTATAALPRTDSPTAAPAAVDREAAIVNVPRNGEQEVIKDASSEGEKELPPEIGVAAGGQAEEPTQGKQEDDGEAQAEVCADEQQDESKPSTEEVVVDSGVEEYWSALQSGSGTRPKPHSALPPSQQKRLAVTISSSEKVMVNALMQSRAMHTLATSKAEEQRLKKEAEHRYRHLHPRSVVVGKGANAVPSLLNRSATPTLNQSGTGAGALAGAGVLRTSLTPDPISSSAPHGQHRGAFKPTLAGATNDRGGTGDGGAFHRDNRKKIERLSQLEDAKKKQQDHTSGSGIDGSQQKHGPNQRCEAVKEMDEQYAVVTNVVGDSSIGAVKGYFPVRQRTSWHRGVELARKGGDDGRSRTSDNSNNNMKPATPSSQGYNAHQQQLNKLPAIANASVAAVLDQRMTSLCAKSVVQQKQ